VFDTVWVVTRDQDDFAPSICEACGVRQLVCHDADEGMGRSLAAGIAAAMAEEPGFQAVMVSLADMPGVSTGTLRALLACFQATGQAVLPRHAPHDATPQAFQWGHPRILPKACWPALLGLTGDQGARHAVDWSQAQQVDVIDEGVLLDVDRPEDLVPLLR
jgi:molybdenum cofactor cytidylyltransferase